MNGRARHALQLVSLFGRGHESLENVCECSYLILYSLFVFYPLLLFLKNDFLKKVYHVTNNFKGLFVQ